MTDDDGEYERRALNIEDRIATMTDDELRAAYLALDSEPDDVWEQALARVLYERGIDI